MSRRAQGKVKGDRMINEIRRLKNMGLGRKKIAKALGIAPNTVKKYLREASCSIDGETQGKTPYQAPWSDSIKWPEIKQATDIGEQLQTLWEEHLPNGMDAQQRKVPYVSFWREYRRRFPDVPLDFHKSHPPADRCEIDYKGDAHGLGYISRVTREFVPCRLYGMILCFSQMFYARATESEKQEDFFTSTAKGFGYFDGVTKTSAVDNTKAAVIRAHRYDPDLNPEFIMFCNHFGTAPLAMRPRKPKDKNLIENGLGVFWRWIRSRIKKRTFFSIAELNQYLLEMVDQFNDRVQRKYGLSRRQKYLSGEKDKLLPLPVEAYSFGEWRKAKPHPDCHIQVKYNFYSAPWQLRGQELDVRVTSGFIEIFKSLERVAIHLVGSGLSRGRYFTKTDHLPEAHKALLEATPQNILADAEDIGVAAFCVIDNLINKARHPLMYLRRAQGILRLQKRYSPAALERACATIIELKIEIPRLNDIEEIIKNTSQKPGKSKEIKRNANPNLRGQHSWSNEFH